MTTDEPDDLARRRQQLTAGVDALLDTVVDEALGFAAVRSRAAGVMQRHPFRSDAYRDAEAVFGEADAAAKETSGLHAECLELKRAAHDGGREQP